MSETIEQKCIAKGVKLTEQRKTIAKIMSESQDHPDVDELYKRASAVDKKISIATVYRTVKLFEESGIVTKSENWGILRQGIIAWIDLDKDIAIERLKNEIKNRPLLQGKNLNDLYMSILQSRENLYSQADLRIQVKKENIEEVAMKIINAIHKEIIS